MSRSIQRELNDLYTKLGGADFTIAAVTKGAFTQARSKLLPSAFKELIDLSVRDFYQGAPYLVWKDCRLLAVDGSILNLPRHASITARFGEYGMGADKQTVRGMARVSLCYDVLNLMTLNAQVESYRVSEHHLLQKHLKETAFKKNDILLLDRGYRSNALMSELLLQGLHFCIRVDASWKAIKALKASNEWDGITTLQVDEEAFAELKHRYPEAPHTFKVRFVRIQLENNMEQYLATSLYDRQQYSLEDLKDLYQRRWQIEEAYKMFKTQTQWERFSGKTARAVEQDVFAKVFMMNCCALFAHPIETRVRQETATAQQAGTRQHKAKINRRILLGFLKENWTKLWKQRKTGRMLKALADLLNSTIEIVRPGRKFKRRKLRIHPPGDTTYKQP